MLVFLGTKRSWEIFWIFKKKSKKSEKMRFFWKKAYGLRHILIKSRVTNYHNKIDFFGPKKNVKKNRFSFFETFFLKWKLDIFFCPFLKLKKKFWKWKNFPFSPSRWKCNKKIQKDPPKSPIWYFFYEILIFGGWITFFLKKNIKNITKLQNHPRKSHFSFSLSPYFAFWRIIL